MEKPINLSLIATFSTDNDFGIEYFDDKFEEACKNYKDSMGLLNLKSIYYEDPDRAYWFDLECSGSFDDCSSVACEFLEMLSVHFRVSHTHNWLVKDLFEMCEYTKFALTNEYPYEIPFNESVASLSGNYTGTEIRVSVCEQKQ